MYVIIHSLAKKIKCLEIFCKSDFLLRIKFAKANLGKSWTASSRVNRDISDWAVAPPLRAYKPTFYDHIRTANGL